MDTIGLLAAWVGVVSFLLSVVIIVAGYLITSPLQWWWATTSRARAERRIQRLTADLATSQDPSSPYISDLISLYGTMILTLVAGVALVLMSIQLLDLAPALLAATLPFNIDSKLLTRVTGLFSFVASYLFIFRLSYLAVRIRAKTLPRKPGYAARASREIAKLRQGRVLPSERTAC